MKLLTPEISSPKLAKSESDKYLTAILYLAGAADRRLCPCSTEGCRAHCLVTESGRGIMEPVRLARQQRTNFLFNNRSGFMYILAKDIRALIKKAKKLGKMPCVRLNGGSDLDWSDVYTSFPDVLFWEYTKRPDLAVKNSRLLNVHMTYSYNENTSTRIMADILERGINVAMVFDIWSRHGGALPDRVGTVPVIDGDISDLRFLDPKGVIVGLRLKSAKKPQPSTTNFLRKA
jgi:hypothetical protein